MRRRALALSLLLAVLAAALAWAGAAAPAARTEERPFEVWAIDQSDTHPQGGGLLYIWQGAEMVRNPSAAVPEVIDLAQAALAAGCPVGKRPHMGLAIEMPRPTHFVLANFESGDVFFVHIDSRQVVGCVNLVGKGGVGSVRTHAAMPTPDLSMVIVADLGRPLPASNRGAIHKIRTDYANDDYQYVETLDLGAALPQLGTTQARAVCVNFTPDSRFAYVTMQQGGVVVVDLGTADGSVPMSIVHVYPASVVPAEGCGAVPLPPDFRRMVINSESRGQAGLPDRLYIFDTSGAAEGVFPDPVVIDLPGVDTHGTFYCIDHRGKLYVWTVMRMSNHVNVVDVEGARVVKTLKLERPFLPDPAPDGLELHGGHAFVTLRGPKPLSAMTASVNPERTPGVLVMKVHRSCLTFDFDVKDRAPMVDGRTTTILFDGREVVVPASDPHGMDVIVR
ncbi:MAG: hypothetical protein NZ695_01360 [Dehalococcoidia bacterium]|jgi:hypothetical protein|nr:hypothetical protein [Dehalococcoidia bacterium]MDW8007988.1 hypothetical protein [Chloroflexota bacterium]